MTSQLPTQHHHHHHHHSHQPQYQRRAVDLRIPAIEKYAYCLCLHVKPTTIFVAVFKLIRALLFASILLNSEFSMSDHVGDGSELANLDDRHKSTAAAVNILGRIIMASVSAVGIYAVISGRAALLMPLYAMLLVDFFFALPAFYNRDLDSSLADGLADWRHYSTANGPNQHTRYSAIVFSTATMIVEIYFLCVIWKCYRYLRLIELVSPIRLSEIYPHLHPTGSHPIVRVLGSTDSTDLGSGHNVAPPPYESISSNMKPPNYEEAIKSTSAINLNPTNPSLQQQQQQLPPAAFVAQQRHQPLPPPPPQQQQQQQQQQQPATVFTNGTALDATAERHLNVSTQVINNGSDVIGMMANGGANSGAVVEGDSVAPSSETVTSQSEPQGPRAAVNNASGADANGARDSKDNGNLADVSIVVSPTSGTDGSVSISISKGEKEGDGQENNGGCKI